MPTATIPITEWTEYLGSQYAALGHPRDLTPLVLPFPVSNALFLYTTSEGRFLIKVMAHSHALYGEADVGRRLEIVGRALAELRQAGLPVEEIMPGANGRYVDRYDDRLVRLYRFDAGKRFAGSSDDRLRAARALRRLHLEGLSSLSENTKQDLMTLTKAYPLSMTAAECPRLRRFVEVKAGASPTYGTILDHWDTVEWALERASNQGTSPTDTPSLVHTDFHPRNALFADGAGEATMIDFDNMLIDRRMTCLAFTILRFAFYQREREPEALEEALTAFAGEELDRPGVRHMLIEAMIFVETEKIMRILHRVRTTGQYAAFLANICPVHVANLAILRRDFVHA